jgi:hypothetical protein
MTIYAVNGKEPIAAWIPSLDTVGNGTTTLTDLVGSNNGTLTNMDAATDWVSDTSNGGVRALDFDGSNDYVECGTSAADLLEGLPTSVSAWFNATTWSSPSAIRGIFSSAQTSGAASLGVRSVGSNLELLLGTARYVIAPVPTTNGWHHVIVVITATNITTYLDGSSAGSFSGSYSLNSIPGSLQIGNDFAPASLRHFSGLIDDIRIFDTALDATDIAYLYNSGNGRGIVASNVVPSRRRRYAGGYGL